MSTFKKQAVAVNPLTSRTKIWHVTGNKIAGDANVDDFRALHDRLQHWEVYGQVEIGRVAGKSHIQALFIQNGETLHTGAFLHKLLTGVLPEYKWFMVPMNNKLPAGGGIEDAIAYVFKDETRDATKARLHMISEDEGLTVAEISDDDAAAYQEAGQAAQEERTSARKNGAPSLFAEVLDQVTSGKMSLTDVMIQHAAMWAKHGKVFQAGRYAYTASLEQEIFPRPVICLHGRSGAGKTRTVNEFLDKFNLRDKTYFVKAQGGRLWMDGYDGEPVIVMDDMNGSAPLEDFLHLADTNVSSHLWDVKHGKVRLHPYIVFFTANVDPRIWYPKIDNEQNNAVQRRLSFKRQFMENYNDASRAELVEQLRVHCVKKLGDARAEKLGLTLPVVIEDDEEEEEESPIDANAPRPTPEVLMTPEKRPTPPGCDAPSRAKAARLAPASPTEVPPTLEVDGLFDVRPVGGPPEITTFAPALKRHLACRNPSAAGVDLADTIEDEDEDEDESDSDESDADTLDNILSPAEFVSAIKQDSFWKGIQQLDGESHIKNPSGPVRTKHQPVQYLEKCLSALTSIHDGSYWFTTNQVIDAAKLSQKLVSSAERDGDAGKCRLFALYQCYHDFLVEKGRVVDNSNDAHLYVHKVYKYFHEKHHVQVEVAGETVDAIKAVVLGNASKDAALYDLVVSNMLWLRDVEPSRVQNTATLAYNAMSNVLQNLFNKKTAVTLPLYIALGTGVKLGDEEGVEKNRVWKRFCEIVAAAENYAADKNNLFENTEGEDFARMAMESFRHVYFKEISVDQHEEFNKRFLEGAGMFKTMDANGKISE